MIGLDWAGILPAGFAGLLGAVLIYYALWQLWPQPRASVSAGGHPALQPVFLFDGDELMDATPGGLQLIADRPNGMSERDALLQLLKPDFPDLLATFSAISHDEIEQLTPLNGNPLRLTLANDRGFKRVVLGAQDGEDVDLLYAALARSAFGEELSRLRTLTNTAPQLIWCEDEQGRPTWANRAYLTYSDQCAEDAEDAQHLWPGRRLFSDLDVTPPDDGGAVHNRLSLKLHGEKAEHFFDITSVPHDGGLAHFAVDANAVVRAENAQREFMQTLSKTFADLSTGLAIFNGKRQLTMFNPALLDMTGLPVEFLSAQPTIDTVLNRMRDSRRLPEPKDYSSWRESFLALEAEAKRGTYCENWDLPDGQTFRVTGRPHPDGALAFLFEDISAEVSLTRNFRTELETSQAVLDSIPEAIAVFSNANTLVVTNEAYRDLWNVDEDDVLQSFDLRTAMKMWKDASVPSPVWPRLEDFAITSGERTKWSDKITLLDGRTATCEAKPLAGRMTMVRFQVTAQRQTQINPMTMAAHAAKFAEG